jgi:Ca-activated chloride channel family protein
LLRDSEYKQQSSFSQVVSLAQSASGKDENGYRSEFLRLVGSATSFVKR